MTGALRIVAGSFGGRLIGCPADVARPTTDRVREALASSVISLLGGLEGVSVCDAFAGSGALGLEMLSRGAHYVQFFDQEKGPLECVRSNLALVGAQDRGDVLRRDVLAQGIGGRFAPYGLLLLDPPYATAPDDVAGLILRAGREGALADDALIVYERAASSAGLPEVAGLCGIRQKRYGKTVLDYLSWSRCA